MQLTIGQIGLGHELLIRHGPRKTILSSGLEIGLDSGKQELTISLRPLPQRNPIVAELPQPL